ncbi:hypothetical protein Aab01nite_19320 [Paractinoplanes abujensis]|nr:hypothetical protein Aab01nite_19320 [Actinoplanes abujensis]
MPFVPRDVAVVSKGDHAMTDRATATLGPADPSIGFEAVGRENALNARRCG